MTEERRKKIAGAAESLAQMAYETEAALTRMVIKNDKGEPMAMLLYVEGIEETTEILAAVSKVAESWGSEAAGFSMGLTSYD